ncbi:MAG: serine/threonine-protein kinase [Pirellulaceae bacterium]
MPGDVQQLLKDIAQFGLFPPSTVDNLLARLEEHERPRTGNDLLALLEARKYLTRWQAAQLAGGGGQMLVLDDYVLLDRIGAGGMGEVFKAEHRRMERVVALKLLRPDGLASKESLERFLQEMRAAARLVHANIVTAYDAGEAEGLHFLVMEFVDGCDLAVLSRQRQLTVEEVGDYIAQAARGLQFAHEKGVVHRDIKPGNLLLSSDGVVKILDMGIARVDRQAPHHGEDETETQLTQAGAVMGTVDFMAPEQAMNLRNADARSDIYSLGCTLYYLLAGKPAYHGETVVEKIFAHRDIAVPLLRETRHDAPAALDAVCSRMMAKDPDQRYQTMGEVVAALEQVFQGETPVHSQTVNMRVDAIIAPGADDATPSRSQAESTTSQQQAALAKLRRFVEGCGGPDKFLSDEEEQSIFRRGGELDLAYSDVEKLLDAYCDDNQWTRHSQLTRQLTEQLQAAALSRDAIDQTEYEQIIGYAVARRMPRKLAEEHCLTLMLDNGWRAKQGIFDRWFDRKRRQYGLL